jgi:hypothetical protein
MAWLLPFSCGEELQSAHAANRKLLEMPHLPNPLPHHKRSHDLPPHRSPRHNNRRRLHLQHRINPPPYVILAGIPAQILTQYPPVNTTHSPYKTQSARLLAYTAQSSFLTNVRTVTTACVGKTYNVQFASFGGTRGSDVLPTWYNLFLLYPVGNLSLPFWSVLIPLEYTPEDVSVARTYQK